MVGDDPSMTRWLLLGPQWHFFVGDEGDDQVESEEVDEGFEANMRLLFEQNDIPFVNLTLEENRASWAP